MKVVEQSSNVYVYIHLIRECKGAMSFTEK
jgi:hypothetical protein